MARKIRQYTNPFLKAKGQLLDTEYSALPNLLDAIAVHQQGMLSQAEKIWQKQVQDSWWPKYWATHG
jgi:hypothetical protein